ncbi:hypothetical protein CNMCM5793_003712 [Aspergillus hiratsukae]|uniref:SNF2 N-terminal domain-containing protein n=1 Tax=Aspergillus hiratsukae TaxID=1194566 RepID=A0A8H6UFM2_9EURO|nr:hypothetical protein CNMCM5793_003712 [Aspergillus hiratsukae]KAF7168541.1 hypothetical protein CNMCM6106_003679 [Aspergillus hiratsukae]
MLSMQSIPKGAGLAKIWSCFPQPGSAADRAAVQDQLTQILTTDGKNYLDTNFNGQSAVERLKRDIGQILDRLPEFVQRAARGGGKYKGESFFITNHDSFEGAITLMHPEIRFCLNIAPRTQTLAMPDVSDEGGKRKREQRFRTDDDEEEEFLSWSDSDEDPDRKRKKHATMKELLGISDSQSSDEETGSESSFENIPSGSETQGGSPPRNTGQGSTGLGDTDEKNNPPHGPSTNSEEWPTGDDDEEEEEDHDTDKLGTKLRTFCSSYRLERSTDENCAAFSRFFKYEDIEAVPNMITIPGLRKPVYAYEAFAVWGGFLADEMGLGKTVTLITLCIVGRWIQIMVAEVERSRKTGDGKHLPEDTKSSECPSASAFPCCCICVPNSPTRELTSRWRGGNLIIVPKKLIRNWIKEWHNYVDLANERLAMQLILGHQTPNTNVPTMTIYISSLQYQEARIFAQALAQEEAANIYDQMQLNESAHDAIQRYNNHQYTLPPDIERFVVLTTPGSFDGRVKEPMTVRAPVPKPRKGHETWEKSDTYRHCQSSELKKLGMNFMALQSKPEPDISPISSALAKILETIGFIRRTAESQWNGKPLMDLPPHVQTDISCPLTEDGKALIERIRNLAMEQAQGAQPSSYIQFKRSLYRLRLTSNLPGLAALYENQDRPSDFVWTGDEITRNGWHLEPERSTFALNLDRVLEHSSKWAELCRLIRNREQGKDGKPKKMIIISAFPIVVLILWLAIQREFPEEYPRAMLAGVKNRQCLIDLFQEFGTGEKPEQQRNEIESPGILLGTTKLLSVGFTCTRANTVLLFEPQLSSNDEEQAYGRIHRIKDQRIMMRQASRKKLHRDATQQRYDNQTDADS